MKYMIVQYTTDRGDDDYLPASLRFTAETREGAVSAMVDSVLEDIFGCDKFRLYSNESDEAYAGDTGLFGEQATEQGVEEYIRRLMAKEVHCIAVEKDGYEDVYTVLVG